MKYYKDAEGNVHAFESDGSQDAFIPSHLVAISEDEADALRKESVATVPASISALDGLLALDAAGLSGAYDAWATSPERTFAERAFIAKAQTWRRDDVTLNAAAASLGLTSADVDALFAAA